jgi:hypothetical protein
LLGAFGQSIAHLFEVEADQATFVNLSIDDLLAVQAEDCRVGHAKLAGEGSRGKQRLHVPQFSAPDLDVENTAEAIALVSDGHGGWWVGTGRFELIENLLQVVAHEPLNAKLWSDDSLGFETRYGWRGNSKLAG